MLKVNELAKSAGVSPHIVRYYARLGLVRPARRGSNGYKEFEAADVRRIKFIRLTRGLGFTLAEIAEIVEMSRRRKSPCPMVRDIMQRRLLDTNDELEQMLILKRRIAKALDLWRTMPDTVPTGEQICHLIESMGESDSRLTSELLGRRRPVLHPKTTRRTHGQST